MAKLHRNVIGAGIVSLLTDISSEMIYPIVPLFLSSVLGAPKSAIGIIEGIAEGTAAFLKGFSGVIADKLGRYRFLMALGYMTSALSRPILASSTSWLHVLLARFVDRLGKGIRTSPRDAIIAQSSSKENMGLAFGFHRAMDTIGAIIGPGLTFLILLLAEDNYRLVIWLSTIPALLAVTIIFILIEKDKHIKKSTSLAISLRNFSPDVYAFILIAFLFGIGNSSDAFLILRAQERGVDHTIVPLMYLVFNVVYASLSTPFGILSDRIGSRRVVHIGFLFFAFIYTGFAVISGPWQVFIFFCLYGVFMAMTEGVQKAFLANLLPEERRATGFGLFNMVVSIATMSASIIAGILWDNINASAPFYFGGASAFLAWLLFPILVKGKG